MSQLSMDKINRLVLELEALTPSMKRLKFYKQKPIKPFYNLFVPRSIRKHIEKQAKLDQQQHLAKCWLELIELYQQGLLPKFSIKPKKEFKHQKIIWQYWGQGIKNLPDVVQLCFASVNQYQEDFIVIRLDDDNIHDYLDFPNFVWQKRNNPEFKPVFFSDLLRLALLYYYGGVWIDATIVLTNQLDKRFVNADFFAFQRSMEVFDKSEWHLFNQDYFSWNKNHKVNMLSSILFAKKNNPFVYDWLQLLLFFWENSNKITHYFFFQILFNELKTKTNYLNNVLLVDDTLPHLLAKTLNRPFNPKEWQDILNKTHIHKLTYTQECIDGSYYDYLKKSMEIK